MKPEPWTCLLAVLVLSSFTLAYASMKLWLAVATTTANVLGWTVLLAQVTL